MKEPIYESLECEVVREIADDSIGLRGYLVVLSRVNGLTCGGIRIHENIDVQELIDHAKVMELKQAFIGLPRGGARAGIIAPYDLDDAGKQKLMNRFAELAAEELQDRRWLAAIDVGTNLELIQNMYRHIGVEIPVPSREIDNAGYYTAAGVMRSIEISLDIAGMQLEDCKFAVEGFGNVGSHLAKILHERDATVVALSSSNGAIYDPQGLPIPELFDHCSATKSVDNFAGARQLSREELLKLDVDVLSPCAADSTINSSNAADIRAKVICAGANNPVTLAADQLLFDKGVLYLPDFLTNAGGALGNMVRFAGLSDDRFHALIDGPFTDKIRDIHRESTTRNVPPRKVGIEMADRKFACMKASKERPSSSNWLYELALSVYRKGLIPKPLLRPIAYRQLQNLIAG